MSRGFNRVWLLRLPLKTLVVLSRIARLLPLALLCLWPQGLLAKAQPDTDIGQGAAAFAVVDDLGRTVTLAKPATRIVALAPHLIESLFAVGAGDQIVGAVEFSDYPEAALKIPRVGGYNHISLELLIALDPDLIVAWHSGNGAQIQQLLASLDIPVYYSEPRSFAAISRTMEQLGRLSGHSEQGARMAQQFREHLEQLRLTHTGKAGIRVFFEIWAEPLMTINGEHLISQAIELCGGVNIFSSSPALVPRVSIEGVMAVDPEVILSGDRTSPHGEGVEALRARWQPWYSLSAVSNSAIYVVPGDTILRHSPRILTGVEQLCQRLDQARELSSIKSE